MRFIVQDDKLIIRLEGMERLWALRSRLTIPRPAITLVDYIAERPVLQDFRGYLRIPGTSIPWHFLAGTFWHRDDREFWFVRMKHDGMLTLETKPGDYLYRRLRISCAPEIAQDISDWWSKRED